MERFGPYKVQRILGSGAMGVVYLAEDMDIGRLVAIKTVKVTFTDPLQQDQLLHRLKREAQSAGRLSHPNIVTLYHTGVEAGVFYIVMEYLEGKSLEYVLREEPEAPPERFIPVLRAIANALDYAHQMGVVHRDIKPENVLLTSSGNPKITDFGIAKLMHDKGMTQTGISLGTPVYMSPEQLKALSINGRTDQFSLAVMAYRMLCGHLPFEADRAEALCMKILLEPPPSIRSYHPEWPEGLDNVFQTALAKESEERYNTCSAFVEALSELLQGRGLQDMHLDVQPSTPARSVCMPRPMALIAILTLVVLLGALLWELKRTRNTSGRGVLSESKPQSSVGTSSPILTNPAKGKSVEVIDVPRLSGPRDSRTSPEGPLRSVAGSHPPMQPLPATDRTARLGPPLWPMLRGSASQSGYVAVTGPELGRVIQSIPMEASVRGAAVVSADRTVYLVDASGVLHAIDPDGTFRWSHPLGAATLSSAAVLLDGRVVAGGAKIDTYKRDGTLDWSFALGAPVIAGLVVANGIIYGSLNDGTLVAVTTKGSKAWSIMLGDKIRHPVSVMTDGKIVVSSGNHIMALAASDGRTLWDKELDESAGASAIGVDSSIYVAAFDTLYCFSGGGKEMWRYQAVARITSPPAVDSKGNVYIASADRNLYAVRSGELSWKFPLNQATKAPVLIDHSGSVYVGSGDGSFYALDSQGQLRWKIALGGEVTAPATLAEPGRIIVGSLSRRLFVIGE